MKFLILSALVALFASQNVLAISTKDHDKIVGCYWGTWSFYRTGYGKFDVDQFDADLCTHGFYGFADLNNKTWEIVPYDPWYDLAPEDCGENGGMYCHFDSYRRFVNLKQTHPNFVPILSLGGWNSGSERYSEMAADPAKKKIFLDSVVPFLKKFGFDGLDFDWEYPGSREGADPEHDKENFSVLIEELGELLHAEGMILTAALSPGKKTIDIAYDIPRISKVFDIMNIMAYDYHGWWEGHNFTGVNTPLKGRVEELPEDHPGWYFNVYDTMNYYIQLGAPKEKMTMGMAFYGRGFELTEWEDVEDDQKGLYCPAHAGIPKGPYTGQDGFWGFQEVQQAFNNDTLINLPDGKPHEWTVVVDDCYKTPYAVNGPYWIGYDDEDSIAKKAEFINFLGIAGGFSWSVDTDDFRGDYHKETFPLLRMVNQVFHDGTTMDPANPECQGSAPMCDMFEPSTTTSTTTTTTTTATTTTTTATTTTTMSSTTSVDPNPNGCSEYGEMLPHPNDCHLYYVCLHDENGAWDARVFNCGDFAFDPNISSCVDPNLPGNELLCGLQ
jgi:chitinase